MTLLDQKLIPSIVEDAWNASVFRRVDVKSSSVYDKILYTRFHRRDLNLITINVSRFELRGRLSGTYVWHSGTSAFPSFLWVVHKFGEHSLSTRFTNKGLSKINYVDMLISIRHYSRTCSRSEVY